MRLGSLFSGIGAMDLGLERAGMKPVFQVEIDAHARRVLAKHWPHVPRFTDVRSVTGAGLPACDILAGGFPCTNISPAGDGAGLAGDESGLWGEFARLIRELQPRYVLVENSSALTGRGLASVLGDLAACGYDAEWDCIPAGALGAPHLRDRCFVVAYASSVGRGAGRPRRPAGGAEGASTARLQDAPRVLGGPLQPSAWWTHKPGVRGMVHGTPARVDEPRLRGLGHAVVVQVAEWLGRRIMEHAR